jgi:hypothetical protein
MSTLHRNTELIRLLDMAMLEIDINEKVLETKIVSIQFRSLKTSVSRKSCNERLRPRSY